MQMKELIDATTVEIMRLAREAKESGAPGWQEARLQTQEQVRELVEDVLPNLYDIACETNVTVTPLLLVTERTPMTVPDDTFIGSAEEWTPGQWALILVENGISGFEFPDEK